MSGVVVIAEDGLLGTRFPLSVSSEGVDTPLVAGSAADLREDGVRAAVVDTDDPVSVRTALAAGLPALLTAASAAAMLSDDAGEDLTSYGTWVPYLPLRSSVDVVTAARLAASGAVGRPLHCDITTWVGVRPDDRWECDAPFARSWAEALVFGLDVAERLLGVELPETTLHRYRGAPAEPPATVARHAGSDRGAVHTLFPASLGSGPLVTATLTGDAGRLLLRQPFAPGALTVWDARAGEFRSPALPRVKPNVQAPDTVLGGPETVEQLTGLLAGHVSAADRRDLQRLTEQTVAAIRKSAETTGGDRS